jgi:hypothetical protein
MSKLIASAIPILPGKTDEWKAFINDLRGRHFAEFSASRKRLGVRERSFLQQTPMGDFVLVTLEGEDPIAAFAQFGQGTDEFTQWFVDCVKAIHGFDLREPMQGGIPEMVIDSEGMPATA